MDENKIFEEGKYIAWVFGDVKSKSIGLPTGKNLYSFNYKFKQDGVRIEYSFTEFENQISNEGLQIYNKDFFLFPGKEVYSAIKKQGELKSVLSSRKWISKLEKIISKVK